MKTQTTTNDAKVAQIATKRKHVVLVGNPNVGKSVIFNALSGMNADVCRTLLALPLAMVSSAVSSCCFVACRLPGASRAVSPPRAPRCYSSFVNPSCAISTDSIDTSFFDASKSGPSHLQIQPP